MSSSLNQGEDEEVADELSDNSLRFSKDGFPHLCEQGDNIDMVCKQRSDFVFTKDPLGTTYRLSLTISLWKNG